MSDVPRERLIEMIYELKEQLRVAETVRDDARAASARDLETKRFYEQREVEWYEQVQRLKAELADARRWRTCTTCGQILHTGEAKLIVGLFPAELEELAFATSNGSTASRLLCALGLVDEEREEACRRELIDAGRIQPRNPILGT